ncbi:MAG: 3-isopropylmalate dehydratase large subunit [Pseudohongiella sp.]|nr:3-isopropylmalate dehydratase large subunit [Pseudohongiella sp.]
MKRRKFLKSSIAFGCASFAPLTFSALNGAPARTLFEKIWDSHVVARLSDNTDLLHVDRHFIHDLHAGAIDTLLRTGLTVRSPDLTYAVADHTVSTTPGRTLQSAPNGERAGRFIASSRSVGIASAGINDADQGIVHMIAPEYGMAQPGMLIVCGDSHTCTQGALGAMAWGIGSTEVQHVLASQTIIQQRPKKFLLRIEGSLAPWVSAKDIILFAIGKFGADAGTGYAIEYAGSTVRAMTVEERLTLCNLSIEMGARIGMVAPDDTTFEYLNGKRHSPKAEYWDRALAYWHSLPSDSESVFDRIETLDVSEIEPQITWGTSPEHVAGISANVPDPAHATDRLGYEMALKYTGLKPNTPIAGTPIQQVFIGSCANSRISDLRTAAEVVKGRKVAVGVAAWVVPGSQFVKRQAEAEGLDRTFRDAGFSWREPGCSMCLASNGETVAPGEHCVSTSNRNFVGRQGRDSITHLASPAMAAAAAVAGQIVDVRRLVRGELS